MFKQVRITGGCLPRLTPHPYPSRHPHPTHLRLTVHAAGVNGLDRAMQRDGYASAVFPELMSTGLVPGRECVASVTQVGSALWDWRKGDRVLVSTSPLLRDAGCHAEHVDVCASCVVRLPKQTCLTDAHWAAVPFSAVTAHFAISPIISSPVSLHAPLHIAVVGGSGAVGSFAIQWLKRVYKHLPIRLWTSSSTQNVEFCRHVGADEVMTHDSLRAALRNGELKVDWLVDCGSVGMVDTDLLLELREQSEEWKLLANALRPNGGFSTVNGSLVRYVDRSGSLALGLPRAIAKLAQVKHLCKETLHGAQFHWAVYQDSQEILAKVAQNSLRGIFVPPLIASQEFPFEQSAVEQAYAFSGTGKAILRIS